ncbi:DUF393 domain-containing protein [Comamonadaceae bacterium OH2545_COT-014]|nr:DUF393 domain-containing protein [Comamonadaceae bacterium OH2545_COT-014]
MPATYPLTLYYDASCPLCAAEMHALLQRDAHGRLRLVDCSPPGFDGAPAGCTQAELMRLMHAQTADGRVLVGVPAFEAAYAAVGRQRVARALRHPLLGRLARALYPHLARWLFARAPAQPLQEAQAHAARHASQRCGPGDACRLDESGAPRQPSPK